VPRVSIVVPNYNHGRYLPERIESLLNQTYRDLDIIVVDDGSRDDSRAVIDRFRTESRIRTLVFTENSGWVYARWNDGAALAVGEYLLIAGADDSCHPTTIERLVSVLDATPSAGFAYSHCLIIDALGRVRDSTTRWALRLDPNRWSADYADSGRTECQYLLVGNDAIPTASAVLMRRTLFEQVGGLDRTFPLMADYILWIRLLFLADVAFIAEPLTYWRMHPGSFTSRRLRRKADASDVEEYYRVICYLARHLSGSRQRGGNRRPVIEEPGAHPGNPRPVLDDALERARERWATVWVDRLIEAGWRVSTRQQRRIYRLARELDPRVHRRVARLLIERCTSRFSGSDRPRAEFPEAT
jgi:glycosyltransferase involved in cell wall biosynthesis